MDHAPRWDKAPCRCAECTGGPRAHAAAYARDVGHSEGVGQGSPPTLWGEPCPTASSDPRGLVADGWAEWLSPVPWGLQLHANCRDPLGEGSWRYVLRRAVWECERATGLECAAFGVTQTNADRWRLHLHALIVADGRALEVGGSGREVLLGASRWQHPEAIGPRLQRFLQNVHAVDRPYEQGENVSRLRLVPVNPRGAEDDGFSLVRYIARYLLRQDDAGSWLEAGDLGRHLRA
jgi:hypothetical protein